jgi:hypothetical protein
MAALRRVAARPALRTGALCAVLGAGAVAGILALSHSPSAPAIAPTAPIAVVATFDPPVAQFGDRVLARVVVALDAGRVKAQTLRFTDDLAPLTQLGPVDTSHSTRGRLELVTAVAPVACLASSCVASKGAARIVLPLLRASVRARDGRRLRVSAAWPTLAVRGRVTAADLASSTPPFESDTAPPTATYSLAPTTAATLLDVLAALSALAALGLGGWHLRLHARARRPQPDALERALRLTREAEGRSAPDRRRALALLGRVLGRDQRARAARTLAWSEAVPEPDELEELVSGIEEDGPR